MVAITVFEPVSSTSIAWMVRWSLNSATYNLRPSGAKARNCGGPAAIGMVAITSLVAVSSTVTTCASRFAV
jgi:hypothetical protein